MYLDCIDMFTQLKDHYNGGASSYKLAYEYWRSYLLNSINNLFVWEFDGYSRAENKKLSKQIENRLLLLGKCGIVKPKNKIIAVEPMLNGITDYFDEYTKFTYTTPLHHSTGEGVYIGKDGILIDNDNLRDGYMHMIHHYSIMLAHTEVTLVNVLINCRVGKVYVASTDKVAQSIRDFRSKLYRGKNDVIVDKSFLGVEVHDESTSSPLSLKDLLDTRDTLLTNFYQDIGINRQKQKRERMIADEVSANDQLLKFNLDDMTECREIGAEEISNVFGINCTVRCMVKDLDITEETEEIDE